MSRNINGHQMITIVLLLSIVVIWAVAYGISISILRKYDKVLIENARLEQQVIDYRWQLEQVEYIMQYKEEK